MSDLATQPADLEERFTQPDGWRFHHFQSNGMRIRFGSAWPKGDKPDAVVICLPGLSEFCEKYYEIARECLDHNYAFWVLDWPGQGESDRLLTDPLKRHGHDFDRDVACLHDWIEGYIKHSSIRTDIGRVPMVMLGHSMGGNIGLRYLIKHPDTFACAAFSAPMAGIHGLRFFPYPIDFILSSALRLVLGKSFTSFHGLHSKRQNTVFDNNALTSDPVRFRVMEAWMQARPSLRIGDVTFGWVYHALRSCRYIRKHARRITIPCLFGLGGAERIVSNTRAKQVAQQIDTTQLVELADAKHEILMEDDRSRAEFLSQFHRLIKENIIDAPKTLERF